MEEEIRYQIWQAPREERQGLLISKATDGQLNRVEDG